MVKKLTQTCCLATTNILYLDSGQALTIISISCILMLVDEG